MYLAKDLLKLEIFHSSAFEESSCFVIDFQDKEAYYDSRFKLKIKDKIHLSDESINNFLNSIDEMDFIGQLQDIECRTLNYFEPKDHLKNDEYYLHTLKMNLHNDVTFSNQYCFICHFKDFIKEYFVQWNYPRSWFDFSNILTNLVDFDVLDIGNSKKWINNFNYDIKKEGVFDNSDKLTLKQFKFVFNVPHFVYDGSYSFFVIDFGNGKVLSKGKIFGKNITQDDLNCFLELLVKYEIYQWENEKYWENIYDSPGSFCDGYHWFIQLTFDNDSIFYIGGHCRHPDVYYSFAEEVNGLFGKDVLRLEDCFVPDRIKYANLFK